MRVGGMGVGRAILVLGLGFLAIVPASCVSARRQRFPGSASSLEELASEVLDGLTSADTSRLESLRLTEAEHNERVYPELPAARPENNHPAELAWLNIQTRNRVGRTRLLGAFGGRELALTGVECRGETPRFKSFVVHTDCWVDLTVEGEPHPPVQFFKDVLDRDGELKIFRYYEP